MNRRHLLKTAPAVSVAATTGLAGCMNLLGSSCSAPSGDLEDALPDEGNGYEPTSDEPSTMDDSDTMDFDGVEALVFLNYDGPSGGLHSFAVVEYSSSDNVEEKTEDIIESFKEFIRAFVDAEPLYGYITVEKYAYIGSGSSEDSIEELMQMSEPLGESCVGSNVKYP